MSRGGKRETISCEKDTQKDWVERASLAANDAQGVYTDRWSSEFSEEVAATVLRCDKRYSVLLVENDDDLRSLYGFTLANAGFQLKAVKNGFEALVELQEYHPDVIVTDLIMPIVDGVTLIELIRSREEFADIPIIAMTAYGQSLQRLAKSAGADMTIEKPSDFRSVCDLVTNVLPDR